MAVRSASSCLVWRNASARPCDNLVNSAATMSRRRVAAIRRDKKERLGPEAALAERHLNRIEALDDHDHPQAAVEQIDERRRHGPGERRWTKGQGCIDQPDERAGRQQHPETDKDDDRI